MKRRIITIDIETLPSKEPVESCLFWKTEEEFLKTGLDGNLGRILCIGYAEQDDTGKLVTHGCFGWREATKDFEMDESVLLKEFWGYLRGFDVGRDLIIGHNIMDFDLPFIIQRSVINYVRPTVDFNFARYRSAPIFDTMREWDCWRTRGSTSLKKLAYALGLDPPKTEELDGSTVYENYLAGRFEAIHRYCMGDVKAARNAWRRLNFTFARSE
jgi:hypothetical protein